MIDANVAFRFFSLPTFGLALTLGIALSVGIGIFRSGYRLSAVIDAGLGALAGGIVGARIVHVLLNWTYFADHLGEALRPNAGGLDWHGALVGGVIGLALVARWRLTLRRLSVRALLDALAPALPLLAFAGWVGCAAAVCGYGAEVDTLAHYPAFAVAESRDVYGIVAPRYNTQVFGLVLALLLLALSVVLPRFDGLRYRRFWILLALFSIGMFGIGFYRGDSAPIWLGLRADQWLDQLTLVLSMVMITATRERSS